jgi:hypothetical protein
VSETECRRESGSSPAQPRLHRQPGRAPGRFAAPPLAPLWPPLNSRRAAAAPPQALTPLTIGRNRAAASALGALWGFGHSTGQLILGLVFVVLKVSAAAPAGCVLAALADPGLPRRRTSAARAPAATTTTTTAAATCRTVSTTLCPRCPSGRAPSWASRS